MPIPTLDRSVSRSLPTDQMRDWWVQSRGHYSSTQTDLWSPPPRCRQCQISRWPSGPAGSAGAQVRTWTPPHSGSQSCPGPASWNVSPAAWSHLGQLKGERQIHIMFILGKMYPVCVLGLPDYGKGHDHDYFCYEKIMHLFSILSKKHKFSLKKIHKNVLKIMYMNPAVRLFLWKM